VCARVYILLRHTIATTLTQRIFVFNTHNPTKGQAFYAT
jgi:hypothetical protein